MDFTGKNILVTGGANGIGRALVSRLSNEEINIGVLDINSDALANLARDYPNVHCLLCDVGDNEAVKSAVDEFIQRHKVIHILVNNAGFIFNSPLVRFGCGGVMNHSVEMWDKVIRTDLSAVFYVTAAVVQKMMLKRTKGVIVNISSIAAAGNAGQSAYSAAKAGVNALTVAWSKELGPLGFRFVGIAPGFTKTETAVRSLEEKVLDNWVKLTPLRRIGVPEEIVDAILFAVRNDFMNGKVIEIDGGLRM